MLLEIAIGDSFGQCFEWTDKWIVKQYSHKLQYIPLEEHPSLIKPGCYTDDTQMAIAVAEFMLSGDKWGHYGLAQKFVECFHRDPRRGYAPGFQMFLENHKNGVDFVHDIHPNSNRSGAAMRAGPLGLIKDIAKLKEVSEIQTTLTHNTEEGRDSGLVSALMVHYFKYDLGPKSELLDWIGLQLYPLNVGILQKHKEHIPIEGWPCVMAAIDAIMRSNSLSEVLVNSVNFAGDTDTICAIAMGPASFSKELKNDIPECLVSGLENGSYGRDYIVELDKKLLGKEF